MNYTIEERTELREHYLGLINFTENSIIDVKHLINSPKSTEKEILWGENRLAELIPLLEKFKEILRKF